MSAGGNAHGHNFRYTPCQFARKVVYVFSIFANRKAMEITMKIRFLGTGAADWNINTYDKDKEYRFFTSALINSDMMIDVSPHVSLSLDAHGGDISNVKNIILTHSHADHYNKAMLESICQDKEIGFFCNELCKKVLPDNGNLKPNFIDIGQEYTVGNYKVIPVPSNHSVSDTNEITHNYIIIDSEGKTLFYGCDGGWIPNTSYHILKNYKFDMVVLDGTLGNADGDDRIFEHNNLAMVKELAHTFRKHMLNENGKIMITHLSKYSHDAHEEICKDLEPFGIGVAYDGLEIEF